MLCEIWEPGKINIIENHETFEERRCTLQEMEIQATCIINVAPSDDTFIAIASNGFKRLVCSHLAAVHNCYIAKIPKTVKEIIPIGSDVRLT